MTKPMSTAVFAVLLALSGCASAQGEGGGVYRSTAGRSDTIITQAQLNQFPSSTAYDAVQRLHPQWLLGRGQKILRAGASAPTIHVYLGGSLLGGVDELRNFQCSQLKTIQFFDAAKATNLFGAGNMNGAIQLTQR